MKTNNWFEAARNSPREIVEIIMTIITMIERLRGAKESREFPLTALKM